MTDYTDPEAQSPDHHAEVIDRPQWTPVYMGEGQPKRCLHCGQLLGMHDNSDLCRESFLRQMAGDR